MTPRCLRSCLRTVMNTGFAEEPPYEAILESLSSCFEYYWRKVKLSIQPVEKHTLVKNYRYEWARFA